MCIGQKLSSAYFNEMTCSCRIIICTRTFLVSMNDLEKPHPQTKKQPEVTHVRNCYGGRNFDIGDPRNIK